MTYVFQENELLDGTTIHLYSATGRLVRHMIEALGKAVAYKGQSGGVLMI